MSKAQTKIAQGLHENLFKGRSKQMGVFFLALI